MYRESQKFSNLLIMPAVFISLLFSAFVVIQMLFKIQLGNNPASNTLLISVWAVSVFLSFGAYNLRLVTDINEHAINVTLVPFLRKEFRFEDIKDMHIAANDFVGYGIRYDVTTETTYYNARGNMGLQITLTDDTKIVIGTSDPEELSAWLSSHGFSLS